MSEYKECYCKKCRKYKPSVGFEPVHIDGKYQGNWCEGCIVEHDNKERKDNDEPAIE
jgi:hypothetical protein